MSGKNKDRARGTYGAHGRYPKKPVRRLMRVNKKLIAVLNATKVSPIQPALMGLLVELEAAFAGVRDSWPSLRSPRMEHSDEVDEPGEKA